MTHILVYGTSILLEGIAAQLADRPNVQIHRRETLSNLGDLSIFSAALVDFNDASAVDILAILRARPDLQIIGVNASTGVVTMLAGHVFLARTTDEVMACLAHATKGYAAQM